MKTYNEFITEATLNKVQQDVENWILGNGPEWYAVKILQTGKQKKGLSGDILAAYMWDQLEGDAYKGTKNALRTKEGTLINFKRIQAFVKHNSL